jgi:lysylphosphatidylglycerol synthase-like protein
VARSVPQIISIAAICLGLGLFVFTLFYIDLDETLSSATRLGFALPLVLLPSAVWQVLRTWGWAISFPDHARPAFTRLLRVRLAADAISFFTVRGVAGEPLKVLLLIDRCAPQVATASIALERLAFAVMSIVIAGLISFFAVTRLTLPRAWDTVFGGLTVIAVLLLPLLGFIARRRTGDYLGRMVGAFDRRRGRHLGTRRVVKFVLDVEDVLLDLLRGDRRRLVILLWLPIVCYGVMTLEIWIVFWAIGQPIGFVEGLTIETFARLGSVASAAIPANIGALEASNAAVVTMLGLTGGGSLALARRVRVLLWAAVGLAVYPKPVRSSD